MIEEDLLPYNQSETREAMATNEAESTQVVQGSMYSANSLSSIHFKLLHNVCDKERGSSSK